VCCPSYSCFGCCNSSCSCISPILSAPDDEDALANLACPVTQRVLPLELRNHSTCKQAHDVRMHSVEALARMQVAVSSMQSRLAAAAQLGVHAARWDHRFAGAVFAC
jgi:hypothetical protein